jgi:hypothetical protein
MPERKHKQSSTDPALLAETRVEVRLSTTRQDIDFDALRQAIEASVHAQTSLALVQLDTSRKATGRGVLTAYFAVLITSSKQV